MGGSLQGSLQNHHRISRFMFRAGEKRVKRETGESPVLSRNCEMVVFSIMPLAEILPGRGKNRPDLSACESIWNFKTGYSRRQFRTESVSAIRSQRKC